MKTRMRSNMNVYCAQLNNVHFCDVKQRLVGLHSTGCWGSVFVGLNQRLSPTSSQFLPTLQNQSLCLSSLNQTLSRSSQSQVPVHVQNQSNVWPYIKSFLLSLKLQRPQTCGSTFCNTTKVAFSISQKIDENSCVCVFQQVVAMGSHFILQFECWQVPSGLKYVTNFLLNQYSNPLAWNM